MKKPDSSHLETLEALLAEKRKHEGYLAKLEERRAGTPEHVFARLRDEYLTKLTDAQVRASAEAESLSGGLEEDAAEVEEAEARLRALEEEKVEGELRAAVGEFENKDWQKKLTALNASIALAEKDRDARREVFERTRALLVEARGQSGDGQPAAEAAPATEGPGAPSAIAAAAAAEAAKLRSTTAMSGGPNFDELEFLKSVVGRQSTPAKPILEGGSAPMPKALTQSVSAPAPAPAAAPAPDKADAAKAPEAPAARASQPVAAPELPLESVTPVAASAPAEPPAAPVSGSAASAPAASAPAASAPARSAPAAAESPAQEEEEEEESGPLGKPPARNTQTVKTLKCQECGSMNYPTEWYCERCGGELAAL